MNLILSPEFQIIKRDFKSLKKHLFNENEINDWNKIIIIYNLYLFFNHLYILYTLMDIISKDTNTDFLNQFRNIYIFFFILCNIKNSYMYFIINTSKIDKELAENFYKNTHKYFI